MRKKLRSWTREDFTVDWFSGTGAGGQHRNKHQNCLRLTDKETGITVVAQGSRERSANMREALNELTKRLVDHHWPKEDKERAPRTEHIRTYNECTNRVVDVASKNKSAFSGYTLDEDIVKRKLTIGN